MQQGVIRKLVNKVELGKPKAFGFIRTDKGDDVFFIPSNLALAQDLVWEDLKEGDRVQFETISHPKGIRAIDVVINP